MKLVGDGFVLFIMGQLTVFFFIFTMVAFIGVTAAILRRFEKNELPIADGAVSDPSEETEIAAAVAAVQTFRS